MHFRVPCCLDRYAVENYGYDLDKAVSQDETTETPEDSAEAVIREYSVVEEEDGELDCGDGRAVEKFDGKDILCKVISLWMSMHSHTCKEGQLDYYLCVLPWMFHKYRMLATS